MLYVNDIILITYPKSLGQHIISPLNSEFAMKDLAPRWCVTKLLGRIQVCFFMSHPSY